MSSSEWSLGNRVLRGVALAACLLAAGCQVQPLYSDGSSSFDGRAGVAQRLSHIAIAPVEDRVSQQVRNELLFLFGGGADAPANDRYVMQLDIRQTGDVLLRRDTDAEATAGNVTLTGVYTLNDSVSGDALYSGRRSATASYDSFDQAFANLRAARDAENRAARELAELIRADVAIAMGNGAGLDGNQGS